MDLYEPMTFMGMKVVVDRGRSRYTLPDDVPVTEAFRREFNLWAAGFFEQRFYVVPKGTFYKVGDHTLYMHECDYSRLKDALQLINK